MKNNGYKKGLEWVITILMFGVCAAIYAAPGDLDTTFGTGGKVRTPFNGADDQGGAVAFQTDGKVIVAGEADENQRYGFLVARYNTDGSLDQTFGEGGKAVAIPASNGLYRRINAVVIQSDGKILIGGTNTPGSGNGAFTLIRFNADGSPDVNFGAGGIITTQFSGDSEIYALGLLTDGRILAVGGFTINTSKVSAIARYNVNGSLDSTFGGGSGKVETYTTGIGTAFAFVDSTRFVVAGIGTTGNDLTLARYNDNGSLDTTFGANGIVVSTNYSGARAFLTLQSDIANGNRIIAAKSGAVRRFSGNGVPDTTFGTNGTAVINTNITGLLTQTNAGTTTRILVSGYKNNPPTNNFSGFTFSKLFTSGTFDTAFGSSGTVFTSLGANNAVSRAALLRSNRIVQVGSSYTNTLALNTTTVAYNLSDGSLDTTFDQDGIRTDDFGLRTAGANGAAIQPDGKIIAVGDNSFDFAVVRYNQNGTPDVSFGEGGRLLTNINGNDSAVDAAIQPDGKIVVAGSAQSTNGSRFALVRYNSNGTLDPTFGSSGIVLGISGTAAAVAIQPDGKIVAVGTATASGGTDDFISVRYNANGSLDTTFGTGGVTTTAIGTASDQANDLKIQPDGKIVVAGSAQTTNGGHFALVRYNSNGTLDQTFGSFGKLVTDIEAYSGAVSVAFQPDGKIVAAGVFANSTFTSYGFAVARYFVNGALDTSFDGDGIVTAQIGIVGEIAKDLAIQSDGKILVVGESYDGTIPLFAAIRFNSNGSLDNSYGIGGKVIVDVGSGSDSPRAVRLDSSGRAVLVGTADGRFGLIRLQGDRSANRPLYDFDGDGKSDVSVFRPSNGAWYLQQSQNGFSGVAFGQSGDKITPADYDGDGKTDIAVFRSGTWYLLRSSLGFTGIAFGAGNDVPMPADYDGDGKADLAVFRPSSGNWYVQGSTAGFYGIAFGQNGDAPVAADYDGDGKADLAVFRPSNGVWYLNRSQLGFTGVSFGQTGDKAVPADYDADGKADIAVFRGGTWYLQRSALGFTGIAFGASTDVPTPADYDGDGKADVAVFRPSNGTWYIQQSTAGFTGVAFGISEDNPIPAAYIAP